MNARTLVISNPNNPTGQCLALSEIKSLASQLADLDNIVIDESFIDFSDVESAASYAATRRILSLSRAWASHWAGTVYVLAMQ